MVFVTGRLNWIGTVIYIENIYNEDKVGFEVACSPASFNPNLFFRQWFGLLYASLAESIILFEQICLKPRLLHQNYLSTSILFGNSILVCNNYLKEWPLGGRFAYISIS